MVLYTVAFRLSLLYCFRVNLGWFGFVLRVVMLTCTGLIVGLLCGFGYLWTWGLVLSFPTWVSLVLTDVTCYDRWLLVDALLGWFALILFGLL